MKVIQKVYGSLFVMSLLYLLTFFWLPSLITLALILITLFFVKVTPHSQNHRNPFAFGIHLRWEL